VMLQAGETRRVSLLVPARAFAWFDLDACEWTVTPGNYRFHIGTSSHDLSLVHAIEIAE
jgi:beta-glucosidase